MKKVEQLAKIFAEIHGHALVPFYDNSESKFWIELPENSENHKEQLDKEFFRKMAIYVIELLERSKNKQEVFAEVLYEIHSSMLVPFYISKENFDNYKDDPQNLFQDRNWRNLEDDLNDKEVVDKKFFLEMAEYIIKQVRL